MMKKFGKGLMLLALAASMVFGFVACGGDDDEKEDKPTLTTFTQEGGTGTLKVYDLEKGKGDFEMTVDSTTSKGTWERGEGTAIKCTTSDGEEITGSITVGQDGTVTSVTVTISATVSYKFVRNAEEEEEEEEEDKNNTVLINYPTSQSGITIPENSTAKFDTVKINSNKNEVAAIVFANSKTDKGVVLTVEDGFKTGDEIKIAVAYNNKEEKTTAVAIYSDSEGKTELYKTKQLVNGQTSADSPKEETYTLTANATSLYVARDGATTTYITLLKVIRPSNDN